MKALLVVFLLTSQGWIPHPELGAMKFKEMKSCENAMYKLYGYLREIEYPYYVQIGCEPIIPKGDPV